MTKSMEETQRNASICYSLFTHIHADAVIKTYYSHVQMRISILVYADTVNNCIHIPFIYNIYYIYLTKFTKTCKVVLNLISLRPLGYVKFFLLSFQSHTSLHLLFFFFLDNLNSDYSM
jgi:hypothetical protein